MYSKEHSHIPARMVRAFDKFDVNEYASLEKLGIYFGVDSKQRARNFSKMAEAMDATLQPLVTQASITTPIQFLQNWLPGFVHVITAARKIDELVGISTIGSWEDEQIVQGIMELTGTSVPYGDYTNIPFASWNPNFVYRTVVRFEEGMRVGILEEARSARIRVDSSAQKRNSSALALEIQRNSVGFYGFNNGANLTYGFLNDPGLPNYVTAANGASGSPLWSTKTYLEITKDIRSMVVALRNQSQDQIDPERLKITLGLATAVVDFLSVSTDYGYTVRQWMTENYPNIRVVSAPELTAANLGANVGYMYAERIDDTSDDDGRTFIQVVPAKFQVLGVAKEAKSTVEDYTNATAGIMCKRPWAVTRITGI